MPIDASIPLQAQSLVQLQNPLDLAIKGAQFRSLTDLGKIRNIEVDKAQREAGDDQALRDAYKNNSSVGPDGSPTVNRQGVLSDLARINPQLAMKQNLQFQQTDLDTLSKHVAVGKQLLATIPTGPEVPLEQKQAAWTQMKAQAAQYGMPNSQNMPDQYPGDSFVNNASFHLMTAEEQLAQRNKDIQNLAEITKARATAVEAGLPDPGSGLNPSAQPNNSVPGVSNQQGPSTAFNPPLKMKQKAIEDFNQAVEASRQAPDAVQALRDVYAAKKVNSLVEQAKDKNGNIDPNLLNPMQVRLLAGEVGKIATGGQPTMDELHGLTPSNVPQWLAEAAEKAANKPTAANAGKFVTLLQNYANSIAEDGKGILSSRAHRIADRLRPYLGEQQYGLVKGQIADEFKSESKPSPSQSNDYPVGTKAKTKNGVSVIYQGNGQWARQ